MGNVFCVAIPSAQDYLNKHCRSHFILGGDAKTKSKLTFDSLHEYGNSIFSKEKEKLIRLIAKCSYDVLNVSKAETETMDLQKLVVAFEKVMPCIKSGKNIKTDNKVHIELCAKMAKCINKVYKDTYGIEIISDNDTPERVCKATCELLYTLMTGFHSEFFKVAGDITRVVKNLRALQEYLDGIHGKLISDLSSTDSDTGNQIKEVYDAISKENERQMTYLTNLVSTVVGPTGESIIELLEDSKDLNVFTDDLRRITGTKAFSDKLSNMFHGKSSVTHAAFLVDKALKNIGMSMSEYKNTRGIKDLKAKIYKLMVSKKPSTKQLDKYLAAADILYLNDLSHNDIVKHLESKKGAIEGGLFADMISDNVSVKTKSVYSDREYANKYSLGREIQKKQIVRKKLFNTLREQIKHHYQIIISDLHKIRPHIGKTIKVDDELRRFIRQLDYFAQTQPDKENLSQAVSGYLRDITSNYIKHEFIQSLEFVAESAAENSSPYIKQVAVSVKNLLTAIQEFNETFTNALTEIHIPQRSDNNDIETKGGSLDSTRDKDYVFLVTMKRAIREIQYYFKISNIKLNLQIASSQQSEYTKDYENILGEECGILIDKINERFKLLTCESDDNFRELEITNVTKATTNLTQVTKCLAHAKLMSLGGSTTVQQNRWDAFKFILEYIRSAKVELIEAARALDLYLSLFTKHIQTNPDEVKDFLKLLEQLEIVSKWFTNKSGDNLATVFETDENGECKFTPSKDHYYEYIKDGSSTNINDFMYGIKIIDIETIKNFIERIEKSFKSMRALDNIIAIFSKFNYKIGGNSDLMHPGLISKAFMKYSVAMSIGILKCHENDYTESLEEVLGSEKLPSRTALRTKYKELERLLEEQTLEGKIIEGKLEEKDLEEKRIKEEIRRALAEETTLRYGGKRPYGKKKPSFLETLKKMNNIDDFRIYLTQIPNGIPTTDGEKTIVDYFIHDPLMIGYDTSDGLDSYLDTNTIYEWSLKSMVSKIFTTIGLFSLFNRPAQSFKHNKALASNEVRQIIGGTNGGINSPQIIPEAIELYIRLTLLGEWYREIFDFRDTSNNPPQTEPILISMIPAFDGIWSRFVTVIFDKAETINDGGYTSTYVNEIIESINLIYTHYKVKFGDNICYNILESFISEVNMRYGMIVRTDIVDYQTDKNKTLNDNNYEDDDTVPNLFEDEYENSSTFKSPLDKFVKSSTKSFKNKSIKNKKFHEEFKNFRDRVFNGLDLTNITKLDEFENNAVNYASIDDLIRQTKKRVDKADSSDKKYSIIRNIIIGVEQFGDVNHDVMLMFHETVINPLTILYSIYKILNDWNKYANVFHDLIYDKNKGAFDFGDVYRKLPGNKKYRPIEDVKYAKYEYINPIHPSNAKKYYQLSTMLYKIFLISCDKNPMVDLRFSNDKYTKYPMLYFDNIMKYSTNLLLLVESNIKNFSSLPPQFIAKYSSHKQKVFTLNSLETMPTEPNVISIYYIKEHLIERLFKNTYGGGLNDGNLALQKIWKSKLYYQKTLRTNNITNLNTMILHNVNTNFKRNEIPSNYDKFPINRLGIHEMGTLYGENIASLLPLTKRTDFKPNKLLRLIKSGVGISTTITNVAPDGTPSYDNTIPATTTTIPTADRFNDYFIGFKGIYDNNDYLNPDIITSGYSDSEMGLIIKFNKLLYSYINMFTDKTSNKIYLPLLQDFANGPNSFEIMKNNGINDIDFIDNGKNGILNQPYYTSKNHYINPKSVLFATMAHGIKNIVTMKKSLGSTNILMLADNDINDIQPYMKNMLSTYLPIFDKQLNLIACQADMIKSFIENTDIELNENKHKKFRLQETQYALAPSAVIEKLASNDFYSEPNDKGMKFSVYFTTLLGSIIDSARSLQRCVNNVYKELGDIPLYFEIYKNSISDYKTQNGHLPLMPLSHVSHLLNNHIRIKDDSAQLSLYDNNQKYGGVKSELADILAQYDTVGSTPKHYSSTQNSVVNSDGSTDDSLSSDDSERSTGSSEIDIPLHISYHRRPVSSVTSSDTVDLLYDDRSELEYSSDKKPRKVHFGEIPEHIRGKYSTYEHGEYVKYGKPNYIFVHPLSVNNSTISPFAYGTRGLLSDNMNPEIKLAPGILDMADRYDISVKGGDPDDKSKKKHDSFDKQQLEELFVNSVYLLRYALDYMYHKTELADNDLDNLTDFYIIGTHQMTHHKDSTKYDKGDYNILQNMSCQTGRHKFNNTPTHVSVYRGNDSLFIQTKNIVNLINNNNYNNSLHKMLSCIIEDNKNGMHSVTDRQQLRVYNILDTNIVPINFHALQRELAFINLMNYSYTFDKMIDKEIGLDDQKQPKSAATPYTPYYIKNLNDITDTYETAFASMLKNPFDREVKTKDYIFKVGKIMSGYGLNSNTPKYLYDQLWNKVLLNGKVTLDNKRSYNDNDIELHDNTQGRTANYRRDYNYFDNSSADKIDLTQYNTLSYPKSDSYEQKKNKHWVDLVDVKSSGSVAKGFERYNTMLIRNIEWIVNLQRTVRFFMSKQLDWVSDQYANKIDVLSTSITDYDGNRSYDLKDFE